MRRKATQSTRKLTLHRETLRQLEHAQLSKIAGGRTQLCDPWETGTNCDISFCICD